MANTNSGGKPPQGNLDRLIQQSQSSPAIERPAKYPNPAQTIDDQINAMPNSDKLSGFERTVYKTLPGIANSKAGQALAKFSETGLGRALGYLDIPAEAIERGLGFFSQLKYGDMGLDDIDDAWSAGSLYYDSVNKMEIGPDGTARMQTGLPGDYALVEARKALQEGRDIEEIRATLQDNLGALAIRSQLQDTIGHALLDPLNLIGALVKPLSRTSALRNLALANKIDVPAATRAAQAFRQAGNVAEAVKIEDAIATAQKSGKAITKLDKAILSVYGGTSYYDNNALDKVFRSKYNPFALTPESKAHEMIDMVEKNTWAYLISNSDSPEDFIRNMDSFAKGSVSEKWGHIALTPQGRTTQAVFNKADINVKALGREWQLYNDERNALEAIAAGLGKSSDETWKLAQSNPQTMMKLVTEAMQSGKLTAQVTPDVVKAIANIPSGVVSKEKFFANAGALIEDAAANMSILQFGVDKKKFITRLSDMVKKYETMAFIKLNPGNAVRNAINNEVTLVARGLSGMTPADVRKYWEGKDIPNIFLRGFNVAGDELEGEFDLASKTLSKVLNGEKQDWIGKAGSFADDVNLGVLDMSAHSQKFEKSASLRASTNAFIEFGKRYYNKKTGFTSVTKYLDPDIVDEINKIDPRLTELLDDAVESSGGDAKQLRQIFQRNLEINSASVIKAVEENLGYKIDDVLGPEVFAKISEGLPKAMEEGKVAQFVDGLRTQMENHVDNMFARHIENLPGIVSNYVEAGGPTQFSRIFGKAMDEFWAGNTEHAIRMSTINELMDYAKASGDYKKVNSLWRKIMQDGENHFGRVWKKMDAYEAGMKEGAKKAGIPYPKELSDGFSGIKKGWNEFFTMRNAEYERFFSANLKGQAATNEFNKITNQINNAYAEMAKLEDNLYREIDDALADAIPDKTMRQMYVRSRDASRQLRAADKQATQLFYEQLRNADAGEQPGMWQKFWQDRMARIQQIRDMDRRGSAALQGDAEAIQQFAAGPAQGTADANTVRGLASQYGISTQTDSGIQMDNRLRATIRKYGEPSDLDVIQSAKLPDEVKTAFADYRKVVDDLDWQEANQGTELSSLDQLKAAKKAEKEARKVYEDVLAKNNIDKKMVQKLIKSKELMDIDSIPLEVARKAFDKRAAEKAATTKAATDKYFLPDVEKMWPEQPPIETAISEMNYGRSYAAMDTLVEEAVEQAKMSAKTLSNFPPEIRKRLENWLDNVEAESTGFRSAQVEYSKMRRDSALLNYNRRNNFDNYLGHIAPFAFWTTHSMANWALHSLDRPAMLTSYMRYQKLLETSGLENELPTRMKGHIRIPTPFSPEWMGESFVNPVGIALPFDTWKQPFENTARNQFTVENRAKQTLGDMLEKGAISEAEYEQAINEKSGQAWDMAYEKAQEGGEDYDSFDFARALFSPHAPLLWAYNAANGKSDEIGPFTPMSRNVRNVASMLGVKDWSNHPYNIEGRIRREMGLPAYDKWDDYRTARMLSNFAGEGEDLDKVREAMEIAALVEAGKMDSKQAYETNELYAKAVDRSAKESAGGTLGTLTSIFGIPIKSYPLGEKKQRELQEQFGIAIEASKNGDEEALANFFDEHPEYEARLGLFDKPEVRIKKFMIDNMWARWNDLPKVQQDELKEQLGPNFQNKFLNKETQNFDAITPEQLQLWLKLSGGRTVGKLTATEEAMVELNQLKFTEPETAWRVQDFYDTREDEFPEWYEIQNGYYELPEGSKARAQYKQENPELQKYWEYRRNWMQSNPELAKYLTDDPKQLKKYENARRIPEAAVPTAQEISANISPANVELIQDWANGQTLPAATDRLLDQLAAQYGMDKRTLLGILTGK